MRRRLMQIVVALVAVVGAVIAFEVTRPAQPTVAQPSAVALTIYDGTALVQERREISLVRGLNTLRFTDVPANIDEATISMKLVGNPSWVQTLWRRMQNDVLTEHTALSAYIGRTIKITTAEGVEYEGILLSVSSTSVIVQQEDGQLIVAKIDQVQQYILPAPEGEVTTVPTLVWEVDATKAGRATTELTYVARTISWKAHYNVRIDPSETKASFQVVAAVANLNSKNFTDATLRLAAAEEDAAPTELELRRYVGLEKSPEPATAPTADERPKSVLQYYLYPIPYPVTLQDRSSSQLELALVEELPIEKIYRYDGSRLEYWGFPITDPAYAAGRGNRKVETIYQAHNTKADGLGLPLPHGQAHLYMTNGDGAAHLIAEGGLFHTDIDEPINLVAGQAPDLSGERIPTSFRRLGDNVIEEQFQIKLRNHRDTEIEIQVVENLFRSSDWNITAESQKHTLIGPNTIEYRVKVPANGEAAITYTVHYDF